MKWSDALVKWSGAVKLTTTHLLKREGTDGGMKRVHQEMK